MSGQTSVPNYRETLFEYPDLTPIHGEPSYESLRVLYNQIKANARYVHTTLGGGQFGHLGLVLTPQQYALLSPTPYDKTPRPPPLVIPGYQLPHVVQNEQSRHAEQVRLFNECNNVENAIRQQIVKAVPDGYLTALRNRQTNTIDGSIPVIMDYLFSNHGRVTPAMLHAEEKEVKEMFYDPAHPIDVIFNKVEDLSDLSAAARADFTEQQLINIAYVIITKTGKYQHYIREWSRLQPAQQSWANFKTQFRQAHQELKESGDLEVRESQFQSANIVQEVIDGVQSVLQAPENNEPPPEILHHMANNAANTQLMPQLINQMAQLMQQMNSIQHQLNAQASPASSVTQSSSSSSRRQRTTTRHYCWTHGACAHTSAQCRSKKTGHRDDATFLNKLGGSTAYCTPTTDSTST